LTRRGRLIFSLHAIEMDRLSRKHKACRFVVDLVPAAARRQMFPERLADLGQDQIVPFENAELQFLK
jgi:hypothetical protein